MNVVKYKRLIIFMRAIVILCVMWCVFMAYAAWMVPASSIKVINNTSIDIVVTPVYGIAGWQRSDVANYAIDDGFKFQIDNPVNVRIRTGEGLSMYYANFGNNPNVLLVANAIEDKKYKKINVGYYTEGMEYSGTSVLVMEDEYYKSLPVVVPSRDISEANVVNTPMVSMITKARTMGLNVYNIMVYIVWLGCEMLVYVKRRHNKRLGYV